MSSISAVLGTSFADHPLRSAFMKWQCRVRQMTMRDNQGRPDAAFMPEVILQGETEALGSIITVMNKSPGYSVTAELEFMAAKTNDPALRREQALNYFSATYYQKHKEFSDILSATFPPSSPGAATMRDANKVTLRFDQYSQVFELTCKVWRLAPHNPIHAATIAQNRLFNPTLHPDTEVLGFEPDWDASSANPKVVR